MIKIGRRGSLTGRLTAHGVQGHTAYPHLADNAAHRLVAMLHALTTTELDQGSEHFQPSTLQVSTIDIGNPASNVIPASAKAVFNIRFNDRWTGETLKRWLAERLDVVGGNYTLDVTVSGESFLVPPGAIGERLAEAIRRVTGRTPEFSTTGGTSDARFIQAYCPVAEFGLVGQTMHKVDERVDARRPRRVDRDLRHFSRLVLRLTLMGNAAWLEVRLALAGSLRLARGEPSGLSCFDRSLDGFWRSFRAAVICYPLYLVLLSMRVSVTEWQRSGGWRIIAVETIGYVIAWVAFPLLMLTVTRWIGRAHRFFDFMVPYNWCQVPQSALFVLVGLVSAGGVLGTRASAGDRDRRRNRHARLRVVHRPCGARHDRPGGRVRCSGRPRPRGVDKPHHRRSLLRTRRVANLDQVEALGRSGRPAGAAVAGGKGAGDVVGMPAAEPDQLQGAGHVAHLVMQKRAGARFDVDFVADPAQIERVERLERRLRLAQRIAKGREIVMADQMSGALAHRLDIERRRDLPHPAALQRRRRSPVQDPVEIDAAGRREPRVEIVGCRFGGEDADRCGPQMMVDCAAQHLWRNRPRADRDARSGQAHARRHRCGPRRGR